MQDSSYAAVTAELDRLGIPFTFIDKAHVKIKFTHLGRQHMLVCNKSQSDYRASKNNLAILRRMLKEGAEQPAPIACPACAKSFAKFGPGVHCSLECAEAAQATN